MLSPIKRSKEMFKMVKKHSRINKRDLKIQKEANKVS